ncbi:adenosylcobinamide hydrolase [Roseovarius nanhaiticus]|uniref:Adenosylcobinamide hydrolase n=1 Tax=Roseovarius nanhaiticus TaxID=573024 RepID=A0A1N7GE76_9RHOB|nr:adenosylcobinamide amidohydrolase [Roseovarius nanhaiticus]SEK29058.1 adenosylcobinamide hydrolase [Roseovarius nanhaiticus]SIS10812.1 adenosylcobinamide hydrolase [Roseovarius nanhaiticus]
MSGVTLNAPWLEFDLGAPMRVLSWAVHRPGFVEARRILWREVRNADLPADLDVESWLTAALEARGALDAVTFLTSRHIACHHVAEVRVEGATATAVATVGLSNAEAIGTRLDRSGHEWGTINIALRLTTAEAGLEGGGLTDSAMIEALSIAASARTVAVAEAGYTLPTGCATGTGTDCIAVAAPPGKVAYAGMHTALGEAAGRAVHEAVRAGAQEWMRTVRRTL